MALYSGGLTLGEILLVASEIWWGGGGGGGKGGEGGFSEGHIIAVL